MKRCVRILVLLCLLPSLLSCTYNPFTTDNHLTGSPQSALLGAAIGAGGVAALGASKPLIVLGGLTGGAIGYYVTTLRFDAGGIIREGGKVYTVGDYLGIYIPTDRLFEPNSADFTPHAPFILDSVAVVLRRCPSNNILISGNTSGFGRVKWELFLSEKRAQKVAAYLWSTGINTFAAPGIRRRLQYVGYGDYFPIASDLTNTGIRQNSRIQITSYPSRFNLKRGGAVFKNYAGFTDNVELRNTM